MEIWKFGRSLYLNSGDENGYRLHLPRWGLHRSHMPRAFAASGCGRPEDFDDAAEIFPEIWKFGNLEIWKFGRSLYLNSGGENGFRPQLQIHEIRRSSMVRECACVLTSMYLPARLRWKKDPRSFSRRVDHSGYLSGLNLQPSGQRSDVLPAQPSGQLWGKRIYPIRTLARSRVCTRAHSHLTHDTRNLIHRHKGPGTHRHRPYRINWARPYHEKLSVSQNRRNLSANPYQENMSK